MDLNDPEAFAAAFLDAYLSQGFQSLPKRDLDLLVFLLLERDGAINRTASNFDVARHLRLTPARVKTLRRDAYARWRPLVGDNRKNQLKAILSEILTVKSISVGSKYVSEKTRKDGFLAVRVEHADDRQELEEAILSAGGLPVYERNRDVLVVRFDTLLAIAEDFEFIDRDPARVRAALKKLAPAVDEVKDLLRKDVSDLKWEEVRSAFNAAGAEAVSSLITTNVIALLRIALPFLV